MSTFRFNTTFTPTKGLPVTWVGGVRKARNASGALVDFASLDATARDAAKVAISADADLVQRHVSAAMTTLDPAPPAGIYEMEAWEAGQSMDEEPCALSVNQVYWDGESEVDMAGIAANVEAIKAKTDNLDFTGTAGALKSESTNMRGTDNALLASNYTAPNNAGISTIVLALEVIGPNVTSIKTATDQLDFTGSEGMLKSESTNMRGTDNALLASNYEAPDNDGITAAVSALDVIGPDVVSIKAATDQLDFSGDDGMLKSESTNMRGTDDALLAEDYVAPDNDGIATIQSRLPSSLDNGSMRSKLATDGTDNVPVYHADVQFTRDQQSVQDEYTVVWFKSGVIATPTESPSPTIQVVKREDGSDLVSKTAMTQIGSTGLYKFNAVGDDRLTRGEAVVVIVTAVIDGSERRFARVVGRDSN